MPLEEAAAAIKTTIPRYTAQQVRDRDDADLSISSMVSLTDC
jgi:hypothetical protein